MEKINSENLRQAILHLETKQAEEAKAIKEQFLLACDALKPINLIKSTFKEAVASKDLKGNLLTTSVGLTAGLLSKMFFQGLSVNPVKKVLGTILMFSIVNLVAKNPEKVKSLSSGFLRLIKGKASKHVNGIENDASRALS